MPVYFKMKFNPKYPLYSFKGYCMVKLPVYLIVLFTSLGLIVHEGYGRVTGETFEMWGRQSLARIESDFGISNNLYSESIGSGPAFLWPAGIQLRGLVAASKVDSSYLSQAQNNANSIYSRYRCYQNGRWGYNASIDSCGDRYYDDNAWIALGFMELYSVNQNETYLNRAREIISFCMSGENGPGDNPTGGIRWHESWTEGWSLCATAPTALSNLLIYQVTGIQQYLTDGQRLYLWIKSQGFKVGIGHRGYENAITALAAIALYEITGNTVYREDAQWLGHAMESLYVNWSNHSLHETAQWGGHDMTDAYVDLYEMDGDPRWLDIAAGYLIYLHDYCKDSNGRYAENWDDTSGGDNYRKLLYQAPVACAYFEMARTPSGRTPDYPVTFYRDCNYTVWPAWWSGLEAGYYTTSDLNFFSIPNKDISALKVAPGFVVKLYSSDNFGGSLLTRTSDDSCLVNEGWNDRVSSVIILQYGAAHPEPGNGETQVEPDPVLSWQAPVDIANPRYSVYLGTSKNQLALVAANLTEPSLDTSGLNLADGTTYYWYVYTASGYASAVWSFTTHLAPELALGWDFDNLIDYPQDYEASIRNVQVAASSYEVSGRSPERAVNGIGLYVDPYQPDVNGAGLKHTNDADHMWICDPDQTGPVWIQFEFDKSYPLGTMLVWNHNVGSPYTSELNRGMRDVTVRFSLNGSTWRTLGNYTIPKGTGLADMTPSIAIPFGGYWARYVRIEAADAQTNPTSNWGAARNFHALSEVRFGIYETTDVVHVVPDISGNGNVGIAYGTPEFVAGINGGHCVKIESETYDGFGDAINARIDNPDSLPLGSDDTWTMNFYLYLSANPSSPTLFTGFGGSDTGTGRYVGRFNGIHFWGGHNIDVASTHQYRYGDGDWQMVTASFDGMGLKLYHDGVLVAQGPANLLSASEFVTIGGLNPWNHRMNGMVDDFSIYNRVLTDNEIAALAEALPSRSDLDWSGAVDTGDLASLIETWLIENDCDQPTDLNGDCDIDLSDYGVMASEWLKQTTK